jgi:hypothetical protein
LDIHVYWNILTMHGPIKVKSPNNTSKWQMGFNSAFKGLTCCSPLSAASMIQGLCIPVFCAEEMTVGRGGK